MAEINASLKNSRSSRSIPRVDLTPMVDLGFLLITFFVFTTTMSEAKVMAVVNPNDKNPVMHDEICESCAITFLLKGDNKLYYYEGMENTTAIRETNYSPAGLRKVLQAKKVEVTDNRGSDQMTVIIKPGPHSSFKNLVDIIDETEIVQVKRYYIDEEPHSSTATSGN